MAVSFLLNLALETVIFTVKGVYSWGKYIVYGHEETTDEKLNKIIDRLSDLDKALALAQEELKTRNNEKQNGEVH